MRKSLLTVLLVAALLPEANAQSIPARPADGKPSVSARPTSALPVRRVILYKNGIGYFEHQARVRGNQELSVAFTSAQLDDVLKSLTVVDLSGGRVSSVRYNSTAPFGDSLRSLPVPLGEEATRARLLGALRGTRVEVRNGALTATGKLLAVEQERRGTPKGEVWEATVVSLVTDSGELRSFDLVPSTAVRVADSEIKDEVGRYLNLIGSTRTRDTRRMIITTEGAGERDLLLSYISEVPVWKSTYRVLFPSRAEEKPLLQGWAVVDNTVGEDWQDVQLSLVAGNPQSFVQQTSQPYYVRRPVVSLPAAASITPQTHEGTMLRVAPPPPSPPPTYGTASLRGLVKDQSGAIIPNALVTVRNEQTGAAQSTRTNSSGEYFFSNLQSGSAALFVEVPGFQRFELSNFYIGVGRTNSIDATLNVGAASEAVMVTAAEPLINTSSATLASRRVESEADASPMGDFFEYALKHKVTVLKNQSALVPILSAPVEVEKVTLWNEHGEQPLRALWLNNTSGLHLDGGTLEVVEKGAFGGEAVIEPIRPDEKRLISYAVDNAVRVKWNEKDDTTPVTRVRIVRGTMHVTRFEREKKTYTIHNADSSPRQVIIEHPARNEWKLDDAVKPEETTASFHRFRVRVDPGQTATLTVLETKPDDDTTVLTSLNNETVVLLVNERIINPGIEQVFRRILSQKQQISALDQDLRTRDQEIAAIDRDQGRVRENMKALKGSAEEKALVQRYARQFDEQENRLITLRKEIGDLRSQRERLNTELERMVQDINLDESEGSSGR